MLVGSVSDYSTQELDATISPRRPLLQSSRNPVADVVERRYAMTATLRKACITGKHVQPCVLIVGAVSEDHQGGVQHSRPHFTRGQGPAGTHAHCGSRPSHHLPTGLYPNQVCRVMSCTRRKHVGFCSVPHRLIILADECMHWQGATHLCNTLGIVQWCAKAVQGILLVMFSPNKRLLVESCGRRSHHLVLLWNYLLHRHRLHIPLPLLCTCISSFQGVSGQQSLSRNAVEL